MRDDRLVEPEPVADGRDLLGIGIVAGDDRGGIAGGQPQHQEHEHRDDQHHRCGGDQTAQDVAEHASASAAGSRKVRRRFHDSPAARAAAQLQHPYLLMFQNTGAGALRMPFTFLRAPIG